MEIYKYTKLASESGKDGLIAIVIFAIFFAYFIYRMISKSGGDISQSNILVIVAIGACLLIASNEIMKRLNSKGSWEITIDDKTLQWNSPDDLEESFIVNLSQIKTLEITFRGEPNIESCDLIMVNDQKIKLSEASGIDLNEFAAALANRGVQITKIEEHHRP